jgi:hypothetical protein
MKPSATINSTNVWLDDALDRLESLPCGYRAEGPAATEPTTLATIALANAGRLEAAESGDRWLTSQQRADGSVAPLDDLKSPGWPTPLAILASSALPSARFDLKRAKQWLLHAAGKPIPSSNEFGHNGRLIGWSWAAGTHSWSEPTAWSVRALKALGLSNHPRTREGVQLLVDRLLSTGGCNYGNTVVLGQKLRPHVEPTGLAMLALADENIDDPRIEFSLRFLTSSLSAQTTPISLSYGLLGLTAFNRRPTAAAEWLAKQFDQVIQNGASPLKIALLALAAQESANALLRNTDKQMSEGTADGADFRGWQNKVNR